MSRHPADVAVDLQVLGTGARLNVAVVGSLIVYRLAGFCNPIDPAWAIACGIGQIGEKDRWPSR
jgi:hypothetical protein